jgi:hypothetical protein
MRVCGSVVPVSLYNASSVASRSLLSFLRTLDTRSRSERWARKPVEAEAPLRVKPKLGDDAPIRWVMRREWISAYLKPTFDSFEV